MPIVRKVPGSGTKKLLGVKISKRVIKKLKQYAQYVGQPINYCAEKLLEYALLSDSEFQFSKGDMRKPDGSPENDEKAWEIFISMGKDAVTGKNTDISVHHDRYLYSKPERK